MMQFCAISTNAAPRCSAARRSTPAMCFWNTSTVRAMKLASEPIATPTTEPTVKPSSQPTTEPIAKPSTQPTTEPEDLRRLLVEQVTGVVRWRESVQAMRELGVETLVEIGAGKVLSGLARRIDRTLSAQPVGSPGEVEALLETL